MEKKSRGGSRPGAGRPATGRGRGNFTTTLGQGTKSYLEGVHPFAGRLIDVLVTRYRVEFGHMGAEEVEAFIKTQFGE